MGRSFLTESGLDLLKFCIYSTHYRRLLKVLYLFYNIIMKHHHLFVTRVQTWFYYDQNSLPPTVHIITASHVKTLPDHKFLTEFIHSLCCFSYFRMSLSQKNQLDFLLQAFLHVLQLKKWLRWLLQEASVTHMWPAQIKEVPGVCQRAHWLVRLASVLWVTVGKCNRWQGTDRTLPNCSNEVHFKLQLKLRDKDIPQQWRLVSL